MTKGSVTLIISALVAVLCSCAPAVPTPDPVAAQATIELAVRGTLTALTLAMASPADATITTTPTVSQPLPSATPEPTNTILPTPRRPTATSMPIETPSPSATPTPAATPIPKGPASVFRDGTWRVGIDIAAGTYRTEGTTSCYWARLSDFTGELASILANDNSEGPTVVTILPTDVGFECSRCGNWALADTAKPDGPYAQFGDGTWRVGVDIAPGTYRTEGTNSCYWARLSDFTGELDAILANDNSEGPTVVTILPTDVGFECSRCGSWVIADTVRPDNPRAQFGDGTWRVGIDIPAGTYRTEGTGSCYWARLSAFSGELQAILANDNSEGPTMVTILPTDAGFECARCGTWVLDQ